MGKVDESLKILLITAIKTGNHRQILKN